ncbi:unnamed protein product, partial [Hymenolepis diminuta]
MTSDRLLNRRRPPLPLLRYLHILWKIIWILLIFGVITLSITLHGIRSYQNKTAHVDLMTRNDKTPGVNENTWLIGTLNYEWEYLRVNKGDY